MKKITNIIKDIQKLSPNIILISIFNSIVNSLYPFVNVIISSKIIDNLIFKDRKKIVLYIAIALFSNFFLFLSSKISKENLENKKVQLHNNEYLLVIKSLFESNIEYLEDRLSNEFILKYKDSIDRFYSVFNRMINLFSDILNGIITIFISLIFLFPIFLKNSPSPKSIVETRYFALIILFSVVIAAIVIFCISKLLSKKWEIFSNENIKLNNYFSYFNDLITDYRSGKEIRTYNCAEFIEEYSTKEMIEKGSKLQYKIANESAKTSSFIALIGGVVVFGIYIYIGLRGLSGLFSVGYIVLYIGAFLQVVNGTMLVAKTAGKIPQALTMTTYFKNIINMNHLNNDSINMINKEINEIKIEFVNVSFKYPNTEIFALKNINLTINSKEKVALVGTNGSGKTTLIKLLCKLYKPTFGEILVNGININNYSDIEYVKLITPIFQDFSIFSILLSENISACESYNFNKLYECLFKSELLERVMSLDKKENTFIYNDIDKTGIEISGGEAQKLAIARALYKDSCVFIMDEPTAAIDTISENNIYKTINNYLNDKTSIFISHRLSSCVFCDKIVVMSNGDIVEEGKHSELINKPNGFYSKLWNTQAKYYL